MKLTGAAEGAVDGAKLGFAEGEALGAQVGVSDGAAVCRHMQHSNELRV